MQFGPGFTATFLYYFVSSALLSTLVASQALHLSLSTGIPQQFGIPAGLLAGLIGGYFNRTTTVSISIRNRKTFLKGLEETLQQLGYHQVSQEDDLLIYERSALAKFLSGKVFVQLEDGNATIATRSVQLKRIRKALE